MSILDQDNGSIHEAYPSAKAAFDHCCQSVLVNASLEAAQSVGLATGIQYSGNNQDGGIPLAGNAVAHDTSEGRA